MRHQKKRGRMGRTAAHRKATLAALSTALIAHKRITTTLPKAKALRTFVEPIITRSKEDTTANRRQAFRYLRDKSAVTTLFGEIAERVGDREGGYTRVVRLGQRQGDAADLAIIELVDYNDVKPDGDTRGRRKRTRRAGRKKASGEQSPKAETPAAPVEQVTAEPAEPQAPDDAAPATDEETGQEVQSDQIAQDVRDDAEAHVADVETEAESKAQKPDPSEKTTQDSPSNEADTPPEDEESDKKE